jgi:hypothetical protein
MKDNAYRTCLTLESPYKAFPLSGLSSWVSLKTVRNSHMFPTGERR